MTNLLKHQRSYVKGRITYFNNVIKNPGKLTLPQLQAIQNNIGHLASKFHKLQAALEEQDANELESNERELFDNGYCELDAALITLISELETKNGNALPKQGIVPQCRLPEIQLPKFDGKYSSWISFKDEFLNLIHENVNLDDIDKFRYLSSCIRDGSANSIIEFLPRTRVNYSVAWARLTDTYDNDVMVKKNYVRDLYNIKNVRDDSPAALQSFIDSFLKYFNALKALNVDVTSWDLFMVHHLSIKLDTASRKEIEIKSPTEAILTIDEFIKILTNRCRFLNAMSTSSNITRNQTKGHGSDRTNRVLVSTSAQCSCCLQGDHTIYKCDSFLSKSPQGRFEVVKKRKLCINCLGVSHVWQKCESSHTCRECNKKHHSLLHRFPTPNAPIANEAHALHQTSVNEIDSSSSDSSKGKRFDKTCSEIASEPRPSTSKSFSTMVATSLKQILIATAIVWVYDNSGNRNLCRVLLDSASHVNFVTEAFCQKLVATKRNTNVSITGIGNVKTQPTQSVNLTIQSRLSNYKANLDFLILPKITNTLPLHSFKFDKSKLPSNIELADPYFYKSSKIDMLIGAELYHDIVSGNCIKVLADFPKFQQTEFGFIIAGRISHQQSADEVSSCSMICTLEDLNMSVQRFWNLESCSNSPPLSIEEKDCEKHYAANVSREPSGRYSVGLPLKSNHEIGESAYISKLLFFNLEKRLLKNPELRVRYSAFMQEYLDMNHMELVKEANNNTFKNFYMPHHCVIREKSETTKLRVVFNGSFKSSNNVSLNDVLMVGPTIQQDLFSILVRFRKHIYAFSADIIKMYRQVNVRQTDRDLQKIWWRFNPTDPIQCYRLRTITYGTSSAPFLAIRTLKQLAMDEAMNYPKGAQVLSSDFYVDDVATGSDSLDDAIKLRKELCQILLSAGFELSKFIANCPQIINGERINTLNVGEINETSQKTIVNETKSILGLNWDTSNDAFVITLGNLSQKSSHTKRTILSEITQIFDPLGISAPVVFVAKCLMQTIWSHVEIQWDDELPVHILDEWISFRNELIKYNYISIPRCVLPNVKPVFVDIHGFGDASERGYGCCVYIVCGDEFENRSSQLLCAKSRVAPLKKQTIPRLELCASLLLAELMNKVINCMDISFSNIFFWTDSEVTLFRIKACSSKYGTFVGNRIARVQELSNVDNWFHVPTEANPADIVSRGIKPSEIQKCTLWWKGPEFLIDNQKWPIQPIKKSQLPDVEYKKSDVALVQIQTTDDSFYDELFSKFSSINRLLRVVALCIRFTVNCGLKKKSQQTNTCILYPMDIEDAEQRLIKHIQQFSYENDLKSLKNDRLLPKSSKLIKLAPFLDNNQLIRVGGRLTNSKLTYNQKHPLLLPADHLYTKMVVQYMHIVNMHCGPQALLNSVRDKYWIVNGRNVCRKIVHECVRCFRFKPIVFEQVMGQLPAERVTPARPFLTTGIDLCGPFYATAKIRSKITTKVYIAVFICFCTKSCHLELVEDLTAETFLASFRRFCARRGTPSRVFTDNATNFKGTCAELNNLQQIFDVENASNELMRFCTNKGITWKTIPPRSPHFGGLWEAAVKSAKHHIKRVIATFSFTIPELQTIIVEAEACLNSRPLTPLSTDPNDLKALTPGHFLIGDRITAPPDPKILDLNFNRLSRWQKVQHSSQLFWKRWSTDYLGELQLRQKWHNPCNISVGTMVIIKDENVPPMQWILGRIEGTYHGKDGKIRVVDIRTSSGVFKRSAAKICVLPFEGNLKQ